VYKIEFETLLKFINGLFFARTASHSHFHPHSLIFSAYRSLFKIKVFLMIHWNWHLIFQTAFYLLSLNVCLLLCLLEFSIFFHQIVLSEVDAKIPIFEHFIVLFFTSFRYHKHVSILSKTSDDDLDDDQWEAKEEEWLINMLNRFMLSVYKIHIDNKINFMFRYKSSNKWVNLRELK
jgi:hypothetical protein